MGNLLLETVTLFQFSEVVLTELVTAARNYYRSVNAARHADPKNVEVLI